MPHAERRRLIEQPITFRIIPPRQWAGTLIRDREPDTLKGPEFRASRSTTYLEDESYIRYRPEDLEDVL